MASLQAYWASHSTLDLWWIGIGLAAQAMFSGRFLIQLLASERLRRSVVPESFWYLSLAGGALLLAYAVHKRDLVFIVGQASGLVVYARNVWFLWTAPKEAAGGPGQ